MANETLMLNKYSVPIEIVDWQRAMSLCYGLEIAIPLKEYKDKVIRTPNKEYLIPSVIQLIESDNNPKYTKVLPFNRKNVYLRDRGKCVYCNKNVSLSNFTFDHVIPQCDGGKTNWENVVVSCMKCNSKKGSKQLSKCGLKLKHKPYIPKLDKAAPVSLVTKIGIEISEEYWEDYIYWNVILMD
ncbi:MAG: HNH endonuclease, partial [Methanothrix sp.]|jgi:5-methylcytosine-specific restriction endonuclease McrA|nr:HNH endonuclease [Methanothrix sp.]